MSYNSWLAATNTYESFYNPLHNARVMWKACKAQYKNVNHIWKSDKVYVKLLIPTDAKLIQTTDDKWRASKAYVASITSKSGFKFKKCESFVHDKHATYIVGQMVYPDAFDPYPENVCSYGIHCHKRKAECDQWFNEP